VLVIREGDAPPQATAALERSVVAVGAFDGVHLGHQRLLAEAQTAGRSLGGPVVVVLFDRHPTTVVRPREAKLLLSDLDQRLEWLAAAGADAAYVLRFDEARSLEPPEAFVRSVLVETLHAAAHVAGDDHHFGHRAQGDTAMMAELSARHEIKATTIPLVRTPDGEVVSSDRIRGLVTAGDVAAAADLLARPFELRGVVEHGDHRGRALGFPTANVAIPGDVALPGNGVYAGWYVRPDGTEHPAAINIGRRPTFYDENGLLLLEAHLLDFQGDLYGERARVRFRQRLRDEVRFDGLDSLVAQIHRDVEEARTLLT
jgi:riboflavin kinase/FMN adenylyltransferase